MLFRDDEDLLIVSFDCQKNQVLPRVPDQSAYYSRQLYKYNLTVVVGGSRCTQTKNNVFIYDWNENEQRKGSNEVSSAVYHCLSNLHISETIKVLRIVSDGCGGQNKNTTMMGMLSFWFLRDAPSLWIKWNIFSLSSVILFSRLTGYLQGSKKKLEEGKLLLVQMITQPFFFILGLLFH